MADDYDDSLLCPDCGYSLRGISSDRCPECGLDITFIRENRSVITWVNRREIGVWRAYWQTVWQVIARRKEFLREVAKPVSYRDAAAFRRVTLGFVALAMGIGCAGLWRVNPSLFDGWRVDFGDWFIVLCVNCVLIAVHYVSEAGAALTLLPNSPPGLAARARILAIYSIAFLAFLPVMTIGASVVPWVLRSQNDRALACMFALCLTNAIALLAWQLFQASILARLSESTVFGLTHFVFSSAAILLILPLVGVGVPWCVFWCLVTYYSLA